MATLNNAGVWRNTYIKPRFAGLDGRVFLLLVVTLLHARIWSLELTLGVAVFLAVIELWKGITLEVFFRFVRSTVAGSHRPATLRDPYRRAVDYGHIENMRALEFLGIE